MKAGYQKYQEMQVNTADNKQLLLMLIQGAIKFLKQAQKSIQEENTEGAHNYIVRVQEIVIELMGSLDMEQGGEIASKLFALYEYMHYQLVIANRDKDPELLQEIEEMFREFLDTWSQVEDEGKSKKNDAGNGNYKQEQASRSFSIQA